VEKAGIIYTSIGCSSFTADQLAENARTFFDTIQKLRPPTVKGAYFKTISVSSTMGPGIKIDDSEIVQSVK
jgi:large subunit ribosomal protein L1